MSLKTIKKVVVLHVRKMMSAIFSTTCVCQFPQYTEVMHSMQAFTCTRVAQVNHLNSAAINKISMNRWILFYKLVHLRVKYLPLKQMLNIKAFQYNTYIV